MWREKVFCSMMIQTLAVIGVWIGLSLSVQAGFILTTGNGQADLQVVPGQTVSVDILLTESFTGSSFLGDEDGLASFALAMERISTSTGDPTVVALPTDLVANPEFDDALLFSASVNLPGGLATLKAGRDILVHDVLAGDPGVLPLIQGDTATIWLGTITLTASSTPGEVTQFFIRDDNANSDDTVTWLTGFPLDSNQGIDSSEPFTITVIPEPMTLTFLVLGGMILRPVWCQKSADMQLK